MTKDTQFFDGIGITIDGASDGGYTVTPIYNEVTGKVVSITIDFLYNMSRDDFILHSIGAELDPKS